MKRNCAIVIMLLFCQLFLFGKGKVQLTEPHVSYKYLESDSAQSAPNYTHFTPRYKPYNKGWTEKNVRQMPSPDTCFTDRYTPTPTAVEVLDKRTRDSKQYADKDSISKFYVVKSSEAIHYRSRGQWLTIDERLTPKGNNRFEADRQEEPAGFDVQRQLAYLKTIGGTVYFNNWMLFGETNGHRQLLAMPDWSHFTVGDDGLRVMNLFPGIDAEMRVGRGFIKTSFIIHKNNYAGAEQLIFADKFQQDTTNGVFDAGNNHAAVEECNYRVKGVDALHISRATAYEVGDVKNTAINLPYILSADTLLLPVPVSYLDSGLVKGAVVIDPLVTTTNTLAMAAITGSMDCGSYTNSCDYVLQVPSLAAATITGISFKFGFQTVGTAAVKDGTWGIKLGNCEVYYGANPNSSGYNGPGSVSTLGAYSDITSDLIGCMPTTTCTSQNIPFTLKFFNDICSGTSTCTNNYIKAEEPFIILLEGHTVELDDISKTTNICTGSMATIFALGKNGLPQYTYDWSDGSKTTTIVVAPTVSTNYQVTITDQCGNTVTGNVAVNVNANSSSTTVETACDSYTWNGNTYTSSGMYTVHIPNSVGCDSAATLKLTIKKSSSSITTATVCENQGAGYLFNGVTYTQSGTYTAHLPNAVGCDSAATLVLTIKPTARSIIKASICSGDTYTFNGVPYTDSGTYTNHFTSADGCDSSSTLVLTVNRPTTATLDVPICPGEKYWINGVAYSTAGTHVVHLTNAAGCDSMVTVNIEVVTHKEKSVTAEICSGKSYAFGDTIITQAGVYTRRFLSYAGCDSIVTLTLTVNPSYSSSQSVTLVYGDTYAINGHVYNKQGTYSDVFQTADGCDSTIITNLRYVLTLCPDIVVPPFFSPNGDGINDFLEIENLSCYTKSTVEIFDRYGKRVARYSGADPGWDGYYLGHPLPSSDYWYLITLPELGKRLTGHFTLKR